MLPKPISIFIAFLFLCRFYPAYLAQQMSSEIQDLVIGSDVILIGHVTQQTASWNENQTRIYTKAIIQVDEYIKGNNTGGTVTVKYPGGEVGEIGEMYSHMPRFEDKEEVLIFLKKDDKDVEYKVYSGENGKISIVNDPKTGEKITTSNVQISSIKLQIKSYIKD